MSYNHCQNPKCHYYSTKDRIRGTKPNKVYTTRKSTNYILNIIGEVENE